MPAAKEEEETGEEPVCAFTKLSLSCDHLRSRRYLLDGIKAEPNVNGVDRVIQVISKKDEPDHIKVAFSGTCVHGNDQCPSITISGGGTNEIVTASRSEERRGGTEYSDTRMRAVWNRKQD